MDNTDDLISIYRGAKISEAYLIKNVLMKDGIDAQVSERTPLAGDYSCDVLVRRNDETRGRAIVKQHNVRQ